MLVGGYLFAFGFVALFNAWGNFQPPLDLTQAAIGLAAIALVAAAIEVLPIPDIDNITLTLTAVVLG